jgi:hypothetical protein
LAECPACGETGLITGSAEPAWEADWDYDDGEAYPVGAYVSKIRLHAHGFHCRVCGLDLGADDLAFAGLEQITLTDDDCDLSGANAYFGGQAADESRGDY